jgi:hypothetical protein
LNVKDPMDDDRKPPNDKPNTNVTPIRRQSSKPPLEAPLEELRQLLRETEPLDDDLSDEDVIRDEKKFRRRFGLGFDWPKRDRIQLISLKHEKDMTDAEIKLFRHSGNLTRGPFGIRLSATRWGAWFGGIQLAYFGTLLLALLAGLNTSMLRSPSRAFGVAVLVLGLLGFCITIYLMYIKPWIIQKRTERKKFAECAPPLRTTDRSGCSTAPLSV